MSEPDGQPLWEHLNSRCGTGCPYCRIAKLEAEVAEWKHKYAMRWFGNVKSVDEYMHIKELEAENIRIVGEAKQCHEQNDRLVSEHYVLRTENRRLREALEYLRGECTKVDGDSDDYIEALKKADKTLLEVKDE